MWMMGYNDGDFNLADSFNGRKLRPLIPKGPLPISAPNHYTATSAAAPPPCLNRSSHDFLAHYHHLAATAMAEQSKRSDYMSSPQVVVSSRWNPTAEQLRALEELYRRGTRTPSAEQIQQITAQLRKYGKIEGKNVFYWFQNHKARERQKRRRQMESSSAPSAEDRTDHQLQMSVTSADVHDHQKKESLGSSRTSMVEVEETNNTNNNNNNWTPSTHTSTTSNFAQESVVGIGIERAEKARLVQETAEGSSSGSSRRDGWIQFEEEAMRQQRRNFVERNATWQTMQLSCPLQPHPAAPADSAPPTHHLINTSTICTTTTATATPPLTTRSRGFKDQNTQADHLSFFIAETTFTGLHYNHNLNHHHHNNNNIVHVQNHHGCRDQSETLELFPLCSGADQAHANANANADVSTHPYPFFEFLPLKN